MPLRLLYALVAQAALGLACIAAAQELPRYQPRPVALQEDAPYVLADGSIYVVGSSDMKEILTKFNELFVKTHLGFKFTMLLHSGSYTAPGGITAGVSAFAPMDREAWPLEVRPFRQVYGYEPTSVRIGRNGYCGPDRACPPGIYVNGRNPLAGLTVEQVARIFTAGSRKGDITQWSQLGVEGDWAKRPIHVYGPRDDGGLVSALRHARMDGNPFTRRYEPLPEDADIIKAVAEDRYGIALVGFYNAKAIPSEVKMLPLAERDGAPYSTASYADVRAGQYPFSPFLNIYVNRVPGKPLDPVVKEYLRLVLSAQGQAIIAAERISSKSYLPLGEKEVASELAKLE